MIEINKKEFFLLAYARQRIYVKKEIYREPKPWTDDPVLRDWFFCNVFRTLDKTTVWIKENIIDKYEGDPDNWKRVIVARFFSRVDCLQDVADAVGWDDLAQVRKRIAWRAGEGLPIHTQGFLVGPGDNAKRIAKFAQPFNVVEEIDSSFSMNRQFETRSLELTWEKLLPFYGVGKFLAYEYVTDFSYSPSMLKGAFDTLTWSNPGPGAKRGMNRILYGEPNPKNVHANYETFSREMLSDWNAFVAATLKPTDEEGATHKKANEVWNMFRSLTMREVEHWLCEYDKYKRGGSAKRRYKGV